MATVNHDDILEALAFLDGLNESGRIEYDDYVALHELISVINTTRQMDAAETGPRFAIGDDTTPATSPWCDAEDLLGYTCTREPQHDGVHVAGDGESIVATWKA